MFMPIFYLISLNNIFFIVLVLLNYRPYCTKKTTMVQKHFKRNKIQLMEHLELYDHVKVILYVILCVK